MSGSTVVQIGLMVAYGALVVLSVIEHQPGKALYWLGAILLTTGVLVMRG